MVSVKRGCSVWWSCCLVIPVLLILLIIFWPRPPSVVPDGPPGNCTVFGDPHINTFDGGDEQDYYSTGEYWIVRSELVKIQGRYYDLPATKGLAVTKEVAVGGPVLKNKVLIIGAREVKYDGQVVFTMSKIPDAYSDPATGLSMQYNSVGTYLQRGRSGKPLHVVHVEMEGGVKLQVNQWRIPSEGDYINTEITMRALPGMDGQCGNFNGIAADDDRLAVRRRFGGRTDVAADEILFEGGKTPITHPGNRPDINSCPPGKLKNCRKTCIPEGGWQPTLGCLLDCCFADAAIANPQ